MLKKTFEVRYELEKVVDGGIALLALCTAVLVRAQLTAWRPTRFPPMAEYEARIWLYVGLVLLWLIVLDFSDLYRHKSVRTSTTTFTSIARANLLAIMLAFFFLYIAKIQYVPRSLIVLYGFFDFLYMWGKELIAQRIDVLWTQKPNVLFVGRPGDFDEIATRFRELRHWRTNLLGVFVPSSVESQVDLPAPGPDGDDGRPTSYSGTDSDLVDILHRESVDYVVLNPSQEHFKEVQSIINICETEGVETWLIADFFRTSIARPQIDEFQEFPMLIFRTTPSISWALVIKRAMDIVGSIVLFILFAPVMLGIAIAIKLNSPGSILFSQRRCTLHGRAFQMYKFRTMVRDAEERRDQLEDANEMSGPVFKMRDDPRITTVGRFLRRYSLDELPQLYNVLVGEMSLVGPRPPIPSEVDKYENWQRRRLSMRPGITCIWQTAGRNEVQFEDWMKLDLQYIDTWSLALDLKILFKTPRAVLQGTGI